MMVHWNHVMFVWRMAFVCLLVYAAVSAHADGGQSNSTSIKDGMMPQDVAVIAAKWFRPGHPFHLKGVETNHDAPLMDTYVFLTSDRQVLRVTAGMGQIREMWRDLRAEDAFEKKLMGAGPGLPERYLDGLAISFAKMHCSWFVPYNLVLHDQSRIGHGYVQSLGPGVWYMGRECTVDIDPFTGQPFVFVLIDEGPVKISAIPKVSASSAEKITEEYETKLSTDGEVTRTVILTAPTELWIESKPNGDQLLVWHEYVLRSARPNYTMHEYYVGDELSGITDEVGVDANTGVVLPQG